MAKTNKANITSVALELFRHKGFAATSMRDVGEACGLLKGSLYSHFNGKEGLLSAALDKVGEEFQAVLAQAATQEVPWRVRATEHVERAVAYLQEAKVCAMMHMAYDMAALPESGRLAVDRFFKAWRASLTDILAEGMPRDESATVSEDVIASMEGALIWLILDGNTKPLVRVRERFHERIHREAASELPDTTQKILARYSDGKPQSASALEVELAQALANAEARALDAEVMQWRRAEAEACFGGDD